MLEYENNEVIKTQDLDLENYLQSLENDIENEIENRENEIEILENIVNQY